MEKGGSRGRDLRLESDCGEYQYLHRKKGKPVGETRSVVRLRHTLLFDRRSASDRVEQEAGPSSNCPTTVFLGGPKKHNQKRGRS